MKLFRYNMRNKESFVKGESDEIPIIENFA